MKRISILFSFIAMVSFDIHGTANELLNAIASSDNAKIDNLLPSATIDSPLQKGQTPLIMATKIGDVAIVQKFLDAGADVHVQDEYGYTALKHAESREFNEIADLLRAHGA
jgi:ankyrin repeat protein